MKLFPLEGRKLRDTASEASLERRLTKAVKDASGVIIKLPSGWYKGIPDRLVLLRRGDMFFIELKRSKKKASKYQKRWIKRLRALGFKAGVVAGSEAVSKFIQEHIKCK